MRKDGDTVGVAVCDGGGVVASHGESVSVAAVGAMIDELRVGGRPMAAFMAELEGDARGLPSVDMLNALVVAAKNFEVRLCELESRRGQR